MTPRTLRFLWPVALLLAAGGGGWYWYAWRTGHVPAVAPPEVPEAEADPAVREAVAALAEKVRRKPRSAETWGLLGKVLRAHGYDAQAAECFTQAESLDSQDPHWPYYRGLILHDNLEAALPHLRRAADLADRAAPVSRTPRVVLAEYLLQAGHGGEAAKELQAVLERERDNPRAGYDLGLAELALGETERARESFLRAARSPFARQKSNAQLAAIYQRRRDPEAVAACMGEVTRPPLDLPWEDAYVAEYTSLEIGRGKRYEEASRLLQEGRPDERERLLLQTAEEYRDGQALILLGEQQLGQGRLEQAEQTLRQALARAPASGQCLQLLGIVLFRQAEQLAGGGTSTAAREKYQAAVDTAGRAMEVKPDLALAESYRGLALWRLGRRKEALDRLHAAVRLHPESTEPHLFLGEVQAEAGRPDEARKCPEAGARLAPPGDLRAREALRQLGN
jgi:tetratricopeptide (TPR) repeat protein